MKLKPLASALALTIYSVGVVAQNTGQSSDKLMPILDEIIVTAQKRDENLQSVPVAVNVFSSQTILEAGINNTHDLAALTPSLTTTTSRSPFQNRLAIRGIGTAQNDPALEPSVGMFVDGVFLGRSGLGMSDLTDVERIEVLQGPQGTLYGKNTNAGAISVITKRPNLDEFEGYAEVSAGDYAMNKVTVAASGPLSDTVAYRLSGNTHKRDGYYNNAGGADPSDANDSNVQGKLLWQPHQQISVVLSASHVDRDSNCCGTDVVLGDKVQAELALQGLPQGNNDPYDYEIATDTESAFEMNSDTLSLHIDYHMEWATFTSITAWNDYEYFSRADSDGSQLDIIRNLGEEFSGDSLSQEFRLAAALSDSIEYQLGLFYYDQTSQRGDGSVSRVLGNDFLTIAEQILPNIRLRNGLALPASRYLDSAAQPGDSISGKNVWKSETLAAFGQMTWHATERLHLTTGLRWTDEKKEAELLTETFSSADRVITIRRPPAAGGPLNIPAAPFINRLATPINATLSRSSENVDWLLKLAYDVDDNSMVYVSASTGTKSGNFNGVSGTADQREFEDEDTLSYELGMKSTFLDSRLRLNSAVFYSEVENFQFQQALPLGGTTVSNEGEVEVSGLDISLEALPLANLTLTAGLLYMNKYEVSAGPNMGKQLPFTADLSGNLGATLVFPLADGSLYMRGDYVFMDDHATSNSNNLQAKDIDDRNVFNVRVGWRNEHWNISVWGKNLGDDEYATVTNATQAFSGNSAFVLAAPRTYGATLRYNF